jgi:putative DNA primase/helicase
LLESGWSGPQVVEYIKAHSTEIAARELDETALAELAALSPLEYDRQRKAEAEALGIQLTTLDKEVGKRRPKDSSAATASNALRLLEIEPWPTTVDGSALLDGIVLALRRFVVMTAHAAEATALWTLFSHALDAAEHAPRLLLMTPEKRCGKTTLLSLIAHLTPRPLAVSNISPAAVYRVIEAKRPTLLIDEADSFMRDNDELRGVVNSGHSRESALWCAALGNQQISHCPIFNLGGDGLERHRTSTQHDRRPIVIPMSRKLGVRRRNGLPTEPAQNFKSWRASPRGG